jgi:HD superfamily phosphohydrolase
MWTLFWIITCCLLDATQIQTFYGSSEVEEPVLLELIESPAFQRLKYIHQYGVAYYTTHSEEYTRYDHSLGVFAILRAKNCSLEEQIAGLLHDVSHTTFSHAGDWIFGKENQEKDYQNCLQAAFTQQDSA